MNVKKSAPLVHVISHGPHCLDGITAAVAVARYYRDATVQVQFSSNAGINDTLRALRCDPPQAEHEVWITDISWTDPTVDAHLQALLDRGVRIYWIDHHRTALERARAGAVSVQFTDQVLSEAVAASRLTYEYLEARLHTAGDSNDWFAALAPIVALADDNDRWLHRIAGSRDLARVVSAMDGLEAYEALLHIDAQATPSARMRAAAERVAEELPRSFALAERSRVRHRIAGSDLELVTAICAGYSSDIADAWGRNATNTVFALFDLKSASVGLRRSPDCRVDLSHLAQALGGGGHPAAAGCELPELQRQIAAAVAMLVAPALAT